MSSDIAAAFLWFCRRFQMYLLCYLLTIFTAQCHASRWMLFLFCLCVCVCEMQSRDSKQCRFLNILQLHSRFMAAWATELKYMGCLNWSVLKWLNGFLPLDSHIILRFYKIPIGSPSLGALNRGGLWKCWWQKFGNVLRFAFCDC